MNRPSVTGKKWIFKSFNNNDVNELIEKYSLNEITARLIAIRKKNIDNIRKNYFFHFGYFPPLQF